MSKLEKEIKKIGIVIEPEVCMGAQCNTEGSVELIENGPFGDHDFECRQGYELEYEAGVKGFDSLLDAGIAVSDIGIAMRRIIKNATTAFNSEESIHAVISMPSEYPMVDQIEKYIDFLKMLAPKDEDSQFSIDAYDELGLEKLTSFELVEKAAEYAGVEKYMVMFRPLVIAYAYELECPGVALKEGQRGLVYDWNKNYFSATIIEKSDGEIDVLWSETIENPTQGNNFFLHHINKELLEREKHCFEETMDVIHEMCGLSGYYIDTIDAVYLAGDFCDIPSIVFRLRNIFDNVYGMEDNRLVALHGAARIAERWEDGAEDLWEMTGSKEDVPTDMKETVDVDNRISLVPTLFKFKSGIVTKTNDGIEVVLCRIYDDSIKNKYMQKGNVYNALLPYIEKSSSKIYSYKGETQIDFKLRNKSNNRMLMMRLLDSGEIVSEYEEKCFAHATFYSSAQKSKKGLLQLKYGLDQYENLAQLDENKYLILTDQKNQIQYVFECWIEQLPMPGIDKGVYVYLDGSCNNDTDPEVFGSGYVLNVGKEVYFGHVNGKDKGRNVSAEYLAATNVFKYLPTIAEFESVTIYFDNINVGYVGAGVHQSSDTFGVGYFQMFEDFVKAHPNTRVAFVHTDSHSGIYGNEIADQMAQGKEKDLMELAMGFKESRDKICPKDGSFSKALRFVSE